MALAPAAVIYGRVQGGDNADLAATLLRLDGRDMLWRAAGLQCDPDVTAWALGALDVDHPDYASLFWVELKRLRAESLQSPN